MTGQSSFGQLGTSTAIGDAFGTGNDILAVSSPTSGYFSYFRKKSKIIDLKSDNSQYSRLEIPKLEKFLKIYEHFPNINFSSHGR